MTKGDMEKIAKIIMKYYNEKNFNKINEILMLLEKI